VPKLLWLEIGKLAKVIKLFDIREAKWRISTLEFITIFLYGYFLY